MSRANVAFEALRSAEQPRRQPTSRSIPRPCCAGSFRLGSAVALPRGGLDIGQPARPAGRCLRLKRRTGTRYRGPGAAGRSDPFDVSPRPREPWPGRHGGDPARRACHGNSLRRVRGRGLLAAQPLHLRAGRDRPVAAGPGIQRRDRDRRHRLGLFLLILSRRLTGRYRPALMLAGIVAGTSGALVGIFPMDTHAVHRLVSSVFFCTGWIVVAVFSVWLARRRPSGYPRWLLARVRSRSRSSSSSWRSTRPTARSTRTPQSSCAARSGRCRCSNGRRC